MKTIITTAVVATFLAVTASAQAAQFVTDPLIKDLAANGQIVTPLGIWAGQ